MDGAAASAATYQRVLVPLDGSTDAELSLPHAVAHALAYRATLHLIRVVSPLASLSAAGSVSFEVGAEGGVPAALGSLATAETDPQTDPQAMGAAIYLEEVAQRLRADGLTVSAVVRQGPVAATVLAEAQTAAADLIIIAIAVREGLARLVLGDVADELLRRATCPVLYIRTEPSLQRQPTRLRSFADDLAEAGAVTPVPLGMREVPIDRIVGSVGRARDLGPDFVPLNAQRRHDDRYKRVADAMAKGQPLPPLQLHKLGYNYYVLDGHHRVAAARALGVRDLEAEVTEFLSSSNAEQQRVFAERREFERRTGLTRVGATRPGTYPRLIEMILEHAGVEHADAPPRSGSPEAGPAAPPDAPFSALPATPEEAFQDAARQWYVAFFQPLSQRIRARRLGLAFPGERTADILVRLRDFRAEEARRGHDVGWEAALEDFATAYGRSAPRRGWNLRRLVRLPRR